MKITSITNNTKDKKLTVELEDNSIKDYTDKESWITDFPELEAHWLALEESIKNSILTPEQEIANKVQEYKAYLLSTDYKMTVDYFATLSEEAQNELTTKRDEAREYIRANDATDME